MSRLEKLFSLEGRTALVTGGSVGIGAMVARAYVETSARVYIASRKLDDLERRLRPNSPLTANASRSRPTSEPKRGRANLQPT